MVKNMTISEDLLDAGVFKINSPTLDCEVIGVKEDFLKAADAVKAEQWESERPQLDADNNWITACPIYKDKSECIFSLKDAKGKTYHIRASLSKLSERSLPFPEAPVRKGVVQFSISSYGVSVYRGNKMRFDASEIFDGKDFERLSDKDIRKLLARKIITLQDQIEKDRAQAERFSAEIAKRDYR